MCGGGAVGVRHDFEPALKIPLEPVDSVELMTLIDNVTDVFMPDQGPARRPPPGLAPTRPSALMEEGWIGDPLIAEHGFAMLVTVTKGDRTRRLPLHAVLGGFHLNGPIFEPLIPRVLDDMEAMNPAVLVPAHCTGWRASHAFGARFGEAYVPNSVGTRFLM